MKKTPVWQIILLVVLLGFLGFLMFRAFSGSIAPAPATDAAAPPSQATGPATAVDMPPLTAGSPDDVGSHTSLTAKSNQVNPNLFRVYDVNPPRNPFIQQPEWFAEEIAATPGYPELKDSDFFESIDPYLPDIGFIYDDPSSWSSVSVSRSQPNGYSITGISEDGNIQTQISLQKDIPTDTGIQWSKDDNFPLTALKNPEWVQAHLRETERASLDGQVPDDGSLFDESGLPVPGMDTTTSGGDSFSCYGVSVKGSKSSALILYNGMPRIVTEGMVLPTHYEVLEINQDGVVLVDVKTGFSIHVPLGGEPAPTA